MKSVAVFLGRSTFSINEVIAYYDADIRASDVHARLGVEAGNYFLVTMHRAENVDVEDRLRNLAAALSQVQRKYGCPVIYSLHPRTCHKMQEYGVGAENDQVRFLTPLGLFDDLVLSTPWERQRFG